MLDLSSSSAASASAVGNGRSRRTDSIGSLGSVDSSDADAEEEEEDGEEGWGIGGGKEDLKDWKGSSWVWVDSVGISVQIIAMFEMGMRIAIRTRTKIRKRVLPRR